MATAHLSIPAPIIEPVQIQDSTVRLRVTRVPSALMASGGYRIFRSIDASAWAKVEGTDFVACSPDLAQPLASEPIKTVTLTGQPTTGTVYYRAIAYDNLTTPALRSPWSNVVVWWDRNATRGPVPAFPVDIQPNVGALAGLVATFDDSDPDAGITWHDARTVMARVAEQLVDELRQSGMSEGAVFQLFASPPPAARHWFEYAVATELAFRSSLPTEKVNEWEARLRGNAQRWWSELFDDSGKILLPGAGVAQVSGTRIVR